MPVTKVWTVYSWLTKPKRDHRFVAAWKEFANWIVKQPGATGSTRLFRDVSDSKHFMSVDSWQDEKAFAALRDDAEFKRRLDRLGENLDGFSSWFLILEAEQHV